MGRLTELGRMVVADPTETMTSLLRALESADRKIHSRAAWSLSILPIKHRPEVVAALASLMLADPSADTRLSCAIGLMSADTLQVREAFTQALNDPDDKVAQMACWQVGRLGGAKGTAALFAALPHPSWRVRLEVCKALIEMGAADHRVVATLEAMSQEPESLIYDAEIKESQRMDRESGIESEGWGTLGTIMDRARADSEGS